MWELCTRSVVTVPCPVLCHTTCSVAQFGCALRCVCSVTLRGDLSELPGMAAADAEKRRIGNWCVVWYSQCNAPQLVSKWCCPVILICCQEIYSQSVCFKHK
jgi:hypothetical protein